MATCNCYRYSFFVRIVPEWNNLPRYAVEAGNLRRFRKLLLNHISICVFHNFILFYVKLLFFRKLIHIENTFLTSFSGCYFCIFYFYDTLNKVCMCFCIHGRCHAITLVLTFSGRSGYEI